MEPSYAAVQSVPKSGPTPVQPTVHPLGGVAPASASIGKPRDQSWKFLRFNLYNNPNRLFQIVWTGQITHEALAETIRNTAGLPKNSRFVVTAEEQFPGAAVVLNQELGNLGILFTVRELRDGVPLLQPTTESLMSPAAPSSRSMGIMVPPALKIERQFDSGFGARIEHQNDHEGSESSNESPDLTSQGFQHLVAASDAAAAAMVSGADMSLSLPSLSASAGKKRRTNRASVACEPCHRAKVGCDDSRPCKRCIRVGKAELCIDRTQRRAGRPRMEDTMHPHHHHHEEMMPSSSASQQVHQNPAAFSAIQIRNN